MTSLFRGSLVALLTPFKPNGNIDFAVLQALIAWHIQEGTDGIVLAGATGEGVVLSDIEKLHMARVSLEVTEKKIPLILGTGSASTAHTVRLTEKAQKLGVSGCLVVTPFYNKPSARGCLAHYREIAKVGLPCIPYYNPKRTGCTLKPEDLAEIGNIPHIAAIKDSSGDLTYIPQIRKLSSVPLLAGDDDLTLPSLKQGAVGAISVIGNLFPFTWKEMIKAALQGNLKKADMIYRRYFPCCKALFLESNPQCVKWLASWLSLVEPIFRLPLVEPEENTKKHLRQHILQLALPYASRGLKTYAN